MESAGLQRRDSVQLKFEGYGVMESMSEWRRRERKERERESGRLLDRHKR